MSNNTTGRPKNERPSIFRSISYGSTTRKRPPKGSNQGVDGIDRRFIDELAEDARDKQLMGEVWDK